MSEDKAQLKTARFVYLGRRMDAHRDKMLLVMHRLTDDGHLATDGEMRFDMKRKQFVNAVGGVYLVTLVPDKDGSIYVAGMHRPVYQSPWRGDDSLVTTWQMEDKAASLRWDVMKREARLKEELNVKRLLQPIKFAMARARTPRDRTIIKVLVLEELEGWMS